jgi:hypothetical protein
MGHERGDASTCDAAVAAGKVSDSLPAAPHVGGIRPMLPSYWSDVQAMSGTPGTDTGVAFPSWHRSTCIGGGSLESPQLCALLLLPQGCAAGSPQWHLL